MENNTKDIINSIKKKGTLKILLKGNTHNIINILDTIQTSL